MSYVKQFIFLLNTGLMKQRIFKNLLVWLLQLRFFQGPGYNNATYETYENI